LKGFQGITEDPLLGTTSVDRFSLMPGSPAIDAGVYNEDYFNDNFSGTNPDLGALESTDNIETWRDTFGHCGPTWINAASARSKAPNRPDWPSEIDKKWGGLD